MWPSCAHAVSWKKPGWTSASRRARAKAPSRASAGGSALIRLRQRVVLGGDRREQPKRPVRHRRQTGSGPLHLLGEGAVRPRQRVVADEGAIAHRGDDVLLQPVGRDRRAQLQRGLRKAGRASVATRAFEAGQRRPSWRSG